MRTAQVTATAMHSRFSNAELFWDMPKNAKSHMGARSIPTPAQIAATIMAVLM
jgi:hypothetical protein